MFIGEAADVQAEPQKHDSLLISVVVTRSFAKLTVTFDLARNLHIGICRLDCDDDLNSSLMVGFNDLNCVPGEQSCRTMRREGSAK